MHKYKIGYLVDYHKIISVHPNMRTAIALLFLTFLGLCLSQSRRGNFSIMPIPSIYLSCQYNIVGHPVSCQYNDYLSVGECKCQERQWGTGNCKDESDGVCGAWCYVDYLADCSDRKWRRGRKLNSNGWSGWMMQSCQACKDKEVTKPPGTEKIWDEGTERGSRRTLFLQTIICCG